MAKIICFEGIDGSGKSKQIELLYHWLLKNNYQVNLFSYPVYDSYFGKEIGKLLSAKENVDASLVDPKSMALWYALDRWHDFQKNFNTFLTADFILLNRYTLSSMVFQSLRSNNKVYLQEWISILEHDILNLPKPNLYLIIDVSVLVAKENNLKKGKRKYVRGTDIYEKDLILQNSAREQYIELSTNMQNAELITCSDNNKMLPPKNILSKVLAILSGRGLISNDNI